MRSASARRLSWAALVLVSVVALAAGWNDTEPRTSQERAYALKTGLQCPVCNGQNVLESNAPTAVAIRQQVDRLVAEGWTDGQVRAFLVDRYGDFVLLNPQGEGISAWVWVVSVAGLITATGAVVVALWGRRGRSELDDEAVALVEAARRRSR